MFGLSIEQKRDKQDLGERQSIIPITNPIKVYISNQLIQVFPIMLNSKLIHTIDISYDPLCILQIPHKPRDQTNSNDCFVFTTSQIYNISNKFLVHSSVDLCRTIFLTQFHSMLIWSSTNLVFFHFKPLKEIQCILRLSDEDTIIQFHPLDAKKEKMKTKFIHFNSFLQLFLQTKILITTILSDNQVIHI
jgi:hypothetical protein